MLIQLDEWTGNFPTALTVYEGHYKTIIMQCDGWDPHCDSHKCVYKGRAFMDFTMLNISQAVTEPKSTCDYWMVFPLYTQYLARSYCKGTCISCLFYRIAWPYCLSRRCLSQTDFREHRNQRISFFYCWELLVTVMSGLKW